MLVACHVHNRTHSLKIKVSSYDVWNGRKANLNYFKVWGSITYYKVPDNKRTKFKPKALKSIFIDYVENFNAYRLLDLDSNIIVELRDKQFFENKFLEDSMPIVDPTSGLELLQNISSSSGNRRMKVTSLLSIEEVKD